MKALILREINKPLTIEDRREPKPTHAQVVVGLKAAALNRRDDWVTQGLYPDMAIPVTLGSDGAGVVTKIGKGVPEEWSGKEVVINPGWNWGDNPKAQGNDFRILGMPDDGTFAEEILVPVETLYPKPDGYSWPEAAALPLAGLTAYRAVLIQGQVKQGQKVLVTGIGGGVATFALQFAQAAGATVLVTSSSAQKIDKAVELGATAGYNYQDKDWEKQLQSEHGTMDLIIDSAGGEGYPKLIDLATPGGRIVNYGSTMKVPVQIELRKLFWKQLHLIGSTMGSPQEFGQMLDLVNEKQIRPVIDRIFPLEAGNDALERMRDAKQFGKIVLEIKQRKPRKM